MTKPLPIQVKVIRKAKRLLKRGWTKDAWARDKDGERVSYVSEKACCWCLVGALHKSILDITKVDSDCAKVFDVDKLYKVFGSEDQRVNLTRFSDKAENVEEILNKLDHLETLYL